MLNKKVLHSHNNDPILPDGVLKIKIPLYIVNSLFGEDQTHGNGLLPNEFGCLAA